MNVTDENIDNRVAIDCGDIENESPAQNIGSAGVDVAALNDGGAATVAALSEDGTASPQKDGGGGEQTQQYGEGAERALLYGDIARQETVRDKILISDEVILQIITIAAGKINGVTIPSVSVGDGIAGFLGMKGAARGIRVETDENGVAADISIAVDYGLRINEAAKSLQDAIRDDLTEMTGLNVIYINVHVISVNTKESPSGKSAKAAKQQKESGAEETENAPSQ